MATHDERFERGLDRLARYADDDALEAIENLRHANREWRASQTPVQLYIHDKIADHITELMVTGSTYA